MFLSTSFHSTCSINRLDPNSVQKTSRSMSQNMTQLLELWVPKATPPMTARAIQSVGQISEWTTCLQTTTRSVMNLVRRRNPISTQMKLSDAFNIPPILKHPKKTMFGLSSILPPSPGRTQACSLSPWRLTMESRSRAEFEMQRTRSSTTQRS